MRDLLDPPTAAQGAPAIFDDQLSKQERMIRDAARDDASNELRPRADDDFENDETDPATFKEFGALGLLGVPIPERFGSVDTNHVAYDIVAREIERLDSGYRSRISAQFSLATYPAYAYGDDEQRATFLPHLCQFFHCANVVSLGANQ